MSVSQFPPTSSHLQLFDISHDCYWKIHHNIMSCHIKFYPKIFFDTWLISVASRGNFLLFMKVTPACWSSSWGKIGEKCCWDLKRLSQQANDSALVFEPGAGWCSGCTFGLLVSMLPPKVSLKKIGFTSATADFGCHLSLVGKAIADFGCHWSLVGKNRYVY